MSDSRRHAEICHRPGVMNAGTASRTRRAIQLGAPTPLPRRNRRQRAVLPIRPKTIGPFRNSPNNGNRLGRQEIVAGHGKVPFAGNNVMAVALKDNQRRSSMEGPEAKRYCG